ncbi:MAG: hypothetical protein GTO24_00865 [candidate division Zixibacteria bacterium]|nr:hypothetical protein [candidate division Zixibacteria bacterium]
MTKIIKTTIIGSGMKSFRIKTSDIRPDMSFDERIAYHRRINGKVQKRKAKISTKR